MNYYEVDFSYESSLEPSIISTQDITLFMFGRASFSNNFCDAHSCHTVRRYAGYLLHDAFSSLILYSTARSGCSRSASSILIDCSSACIVSRF